MLFRSGCIIPPMITFRRSLLNKDHILLSQSKGSQSHNSESVAKIKRKTHARKCIQGIKKVLLTAMGFTTILTIPRIQKRTIMNQIIIP